MAKKLTNKQKKQLRIIISIVVFLVTLIVTGVTWICVKLTTPPSLEEVIANIDINSAEISMDVTITTDDSITNYVFVVSESNNYISIVKEENNVEETKILYKTNDQYFLYQKTTSEITIELRETDALDMYKSLESQVISLEDYLNVDFGSIKYYNYSETEVTYSNYREGIFYDNKINLLNDELVEFTQIYTKNNKINTVNVKIIENLNIFIPNNN